VGVVPLRGVAVADGALAPGEPPQPASASMTATLAAINVPARARCHNVACRLRPPAPRALLIRITGLASYN
jgi:hypothetical protein